MHSIMPVIPHPTHKHGSDSLEQFILVHCKYDKLHNTITECGQCETPSDT